MNSSGSKHEDHQSLFDRILLILLRMANPIKDILFKKSAWLANPLYTPHLQTTSPCYMCQTFWITGPGLSPSVLDKKIQNYMFNICFLVCILVFAPCVYIDIPLWRSRSELNFWAIVFGFLTYYIFRSYDKKFEKFMINISFVVCILVFVPFVYIELPILSFWSFIFGQWDSYSLYI